MDDEEKAIEDETLIGKLRAKARRIHRRAFIIAAVATLVALAFPG
jgi:hypothetical protein